MNRYVFLFFFIFFSFTSFSQSITNTAHNLSTSGTGNIQALNEDEICIFCHTPHTSNPKGPLWNRETSGKNYILYNSSTVNALPGQPDGSSILCLSCHDGTVALGNIISKNNRTDFNEGIITLNHRESNISTDLSDDHIISFDYNSGLAQKDGGLKDPMALDPHIKLEKGKVQCTSCHDPHKDIYGKFLVNSNQNSLLCLSCHDIENWQSSNHAISNAEWNGSGSNPWNNSDYHTVAENACENCHDTHSAPGRERLLKYEAEENNCMDCHNGNVAKMNIQNEFNRPYSHNVFAYFKTHDANEEETVLKKHVECVDCHNPHGSTDLKASPPLVKGSNANVTGVDVNGNPVKNVQFEYEICFRCHADSPDKSRSSISRQIEQNNVRLEFNTSNPSYHPVVGSGTNMNVSSLISPYTEISTIYCTDCHSSSGKNSSEGPHGSIYPHILKYNYSTVKGTQESYYSYELCYQCHDRSHIINDQPNDFQKLVHNKHIIKEHTPCSVCHDPHGVSSMQGNATNNSNLINFDIQSVKPVNGVLKFEDNGELSGTCYLNCHGVVHNPKSYD